MQLATSAFRDRDLIASSGLAPVGIVVSPPRWRLPYEFSNISVLAPHGLLDIEDEAEFERLYRQRLDGFGADRILAILEAIAAAHDADGAVLLCYEDLRKPGEWCHRTHAARFLADHTGQPVHELRELAATTA